MQWLIQLFVIGIVVTRFDAIHISVNMNATKQKAARETLALPAAEPRIQFVSVVKTRTVGMMIKHGGIFFYAFTARLSGRFPSVYHK